MPRNSTGTYTKPLPDVNTGETIQSSYENTTTDDQAVELTDSLSRSGKGGMLAPLRGVSGSAANPAFSFTDETGTGTYRASAGEVRVAVGGTDIFRYTATGLDAWNGTAWAPYLYEGKPLTSPLLAADGTNLKPFYTFNSDPDTGFYWVSPGVLGLSIQGVLVMTFEADGINCLQNLKAFQP